jgi:hypothetical protein
MQQLAGLERLDEALTVDKLRKANIPIKHEFVDYEFFMNTDGMQTGKSSSKIIDITDEGIMFRERRNVIPWYYYSKTEKLTFIMKKRKLVYVKEWLKSGSSVIYEVGRK